MTVNVDFYYDFGSPNAYLVHRVLPQIEARTGVGVRYLPVLLGGVFKATNNQSPLFAFSGVKGKLDYDRLEIDRFIKTHGLAEFAFNGHFPVNTLLMMRGAIAAQAAGVHDRYVQAGFRAMWEDGLKMDDPQVFAEAMTRTGLDGAALLAQTQAPAVKSGLIAATQAAVERRIFGVPTVFVGDEIFFGKERLAQIEQQILTHSGAGAGAP